MTAKIAFRPVETRYSNIRTALADHIDRKLVAVNRKLAKLGAPLATVTYGPRTDLVIETEGGFRYTVEVFEMVTVTGVEAHLDGWTPVASLDHTYGDRPIVSKFPLAVENDIAVPADQLTRGSVCDHCGIDIARNLTIVFRHDDGRWVQVGTTCVLDFIGVDPRHVLTLGAVNTVTDDDDDWMAGGSTAYTVDPRTFLAVAEIVTDAIGFVRSSETGATKDIVQNIVYSRDPAHRLAQEFPGASLAAAAPMVDRIVEWVLAQDASSDFIANAQIAVTSHRSGRRTEGILASLPSVYRRAEARRIEQEARPARQTPTEHLGAIGAKLTVEGVVTTRVPVETQFGVSLRLTVVTDDGAAVTTFGSGRTLWDTEQGERVEFSGTVKAHESSDRWGAQTVLTRAKVKVLAEV